MMIFHFKLQYKRICRIIDDFGVPPILGIPLIFVVFVLFSNLIFSKTTYAPVLYAGLALFYIFSFGSSERNTFLKTVFSKKLFQKIRITENILMATPFSIFLLSKTEVYYSIFLILVSAFASFVNTSKKMSFVIPTPFFKHPFEFIIGFRRFFWLLPIAYSLAVISVNVGNFNLGIFSLCLLYLVIPNFYEKREPDLFVWVYTLSAKEFLKHKVKTATLYSVWLCLPIHLALWIAFPKNFYISILFQIVGFCFLTACILGKYKYFPKKTLITTSITIGVCLLFPPLFAVVIPYLHKEAITNLQRYLYD